MSVRTRRSPACKRDVATSRGNRCDENDTLFLREPQGIGEGSDGVREGCLRSPRSSRLTALAVSPAPPASSPFVRPAASRSLRAAPRTGRLPRMTRFEHSPSPRRQHTSGTQDGTTRKGVETPAARTWAMNPPRHPGMLGMFQLVFQSCGWSALTGQRQTSGRASNRKAEEERTWRSSSPRFPDTVAHAPGRGPLT